MSTAVKRTLVVLGAIGAIAAANARDAHADPMDTVAVQGAIVCAALTESPSVLTLESQVARLNAAYTEASENQVMHYAMNTLCPQYRYLAYAALRDILNNAGVQGGSTV